MACRGTKEVAVSVRFASIGLVAALMPLAVEIPYDSTGSDFGATRVRVGAGVGTYAFVARGCNGEVVDEVPARLTDAGVSLEQQIGRSPLVVGVRGGWVRHEIGSPRQGIAGFYGVPLDATLENAYVNPYLSIDGDDAGVGMGPVFHRHEFITAGEGAREQENHPLNDVSGHIRVGSQDGRRFVIQWMEGVPLSSGGGYLTALLGQPFEAFPEWTLFGGLGAGGPQEGAGLVLRLERATPSGVSLDLTGRMGFSGNRFAGGAALGLTYTMGGAAPRAAPDPWKGVTRDE